MNEHYYTQQDIQRAVEAGIISESQHQRLVSLSRSRALGTKDLHEDDEPFGLAAGLNEILISVGLVMALGALFALSIGILSAIVAWFIAPFFIRTRRMQASGMVIYGFLAFSVGIFTQALFDSMHESASYAIASMAVFAVSIVFYLRLKLPIVFTGAAIALLVAVMVSTGIFLETITGENPNFKDFFHMAQSPLTSVVTLLCGIGFFMVAMIYDMKDPHRIARYNQNAFWLHLIAGPTIVNTVVYTLYDIDTTFSYTAVTAVIFGIAMVSMVVDRRSLLLSTTIYVIIIITPAFEEIFSRQSVTYVFLLIGTLLVMMGTYWNKMRTKLMYLLPDFPYKKRLPPYQY